MSKKTLRKRTIRKTKSERIQSTVSEKLQYRKYGDFIRRTRLSKNISQATLAKTLGISEGLLSRIENGSVTPNIFVWAKFCYLFKTPISPF